MYILTSMKRYTRICPDTYGNVCACMQGALRQSLKVPGLNPIMFLLVLSRVQEEDLQVRN